MGILFCNTFQLKLKHAVCIKRLKMYGTAPEKPSLQFSRTPRSLRGNIPPVLAAAFCLLFGLALIANVHPIGDGLWYWYAALFREKHKLYSDLHYNLQPFFVLVTALGQSLFGSGWIASKAVPAFQLIAYVVSLLSVVRRVAWRPWERAILLLAVFGIMISISFFRFDDYHITTDLFEMFSILLFLRLQENEAQTIGEALFTATLLGLLSGFSMANRLNDGAALLVAALVIFVFSVRRFRFMGSLVLMVSAAAGLLGIVRLTGDSIHSWAQESIFKAAQIKGGAGLLFLIPIKLPFKSIHYAHYYPAEMASVFCAAFLIALLLPLSAIVAGKNIRRRPAAYWTVAFLLLCLYPVVHYYMVTGSFIVQVGNIAVVPLYALNIWVICRMGKRLLGKPSKGWRPQEMLLLVSFLQMLAGATSAGIGMALITPTLATSLLLLPLSLPGGIPEDLPKRSLIHVLCFFAFVAYSPKWNHPYFWHHYTSKAMFTDRVIYPHPTLGRMYIEKEQLKLVRKFCNHIEQAGKPTELLSIPFPYPNYFCGLPPWRGYVQTWYDTSGEQRIDDLDAQLLQRPPQWIVYQRALDTMLIHEQVYAGRRSLPHRKLDRLIRDKIKSGDWRIVEYSSLDDADWFLIQTR